MQKVTAVHVIMLGHTDRQIVKLVVANQPKDGNYSWIVFTLLLLYYIFVLYIPGKKIRVKALSNMYTLYIIELVLK